MSPWIEDARRLDLADDVDSVEVLYTDAVERFLGERGSVLVAAPKGCGKTLLAKLKRAKLLDESPNFRVLPENQMVDVPPGHAPSLSTKAEQMRTAAEFFGRLWQAAIMIAAIRLWDAPVKADRSAPVHRLLNQPEADTPFLIFTQMLDMNPAQIEAVRKDIAGVLAPVFKSIHSPTAAFIDNVDEYFGHMLDGGVNPLWGKLEPDAWRHCQIGLLIAIRTLAGLNPHVKVYGTIRAEALNAARGEIKDFVNLAAHVIELAHTDDELSAIFESNIRRDKRLADPAARTEIGRFWGAACENIRHRTTGETEPVFDYILRHTLRRPRDLMIIGRRLSNVPPAQRTPDRLRREVNEAAADIGQTFLQEVYSHVDPFDPALAFDLIKDTVLTRDEVDRIEAEYRSRRDEDPECAPHDDAGAPIRSLFQAGLVGAVQQSEYGRQLVQNFQSASRLGSRTANRERCRLPESETYLVHPVLGSLIRKTVGAATVRTGSMNIIGFDRVWTRDQGQRFIVSGDVCGFSSMSEVDQRRIADLLDQEIAQLGRDVEFALHTKGDEFIICDPSGYRALMMASEIAALLRTAPYGAQLRVGVDFGFASVAIDGDQGERLQQDQTVIRSTRLQQIGRPDHVVLSAGCAEALRHYSLHWPINRAGAKDLGKARGKSGWNLGTSKAKDIMEVLYLLPLDAIKQ